MQKHCKHCTTPLPLAASLNSLETAMSYSSKRDIQTPQAFDHTQTRPKTHLNLNFNRFKGLKTCFTQGKPELAPAGGFQLAGRKSPPSWLFSRSSPGNRASVGHLRICLACWEIKKDTHPFVWVLGSFKGSQSQPIFSFPIDGLEWWLGLQRGFQFTFEGGQTTQTGCSTQRVA